MPSMSIPLSRINTALPLASPSMSTDESPAPSFAGVGVGVGTDPSTASVTYHGRSGARTPYKDRDQDQDEPESLNTPPLSPYGTDDGIYIGDTVARTPSSPFSPLSPQTLLTPLTPSPLTRPTADSIQRTESGHAGVRNIKSARFALNGVCDADADAKNEDAVRIALRFRESSPTGASAGNVGGWDDEVSGHVVRVLPPPSSASSVRATLGREQGRRGGFDLVQKGWVAGFSPRVSPRSSPRVSPAVSDTPRQGSATNAQTGTGTDMDVYADAGDTSSKGQNVRWSGRTPHPYPRSPSASASTRGLPRLQTGAFTRTPPSPLTPMTPLTPITPMPMTSAPSTPISMSNGNPAVATPLTLTLTLTPCIKPGYIPPTLERALITPLPGLGGGEDEGQREAEDVQDGYDAEQDYFGRGEWTRRAGQPQVGRLCATETEHGGAETGATQDGARLLSAPHDDDGAAVPPVPPLPDLIAAGLSPNLVGKAPRDGTAGISSSIPIPVPHGTGASALHAPLVAHLALLHPNTPKEIVGFVAERLLSTEYPLGYVAPAQAARVGLSGEMSQHGRSEDGDHLNMIEELQEPEQHDNAEAWTPIWTSPADVARAGLGMDAAKGTVQTGGGAGVDARLEWMYEVARTSWGLLVARKEAREWERE